jgi:hypothetical protein
MTITKDYRLMGMLSLSFAFKDWKSSQFMSNSIGAKVVSLSILCLQLAFSSVALLYVSGLEVSVNHSFYVVLYCFSFVVIHSPGNLRILPKQI